jgi:hypothetical protein
VDVLGIHRLVPDPQDVQAVDETLRGINAHELVDRFRDAVDRSAFDRAQYEGYATFLERLLAPSKVPWIPDIAAFPSIAQRLFARGAFDNSRQPTETLLVVRLEKPLRDREARGLVVSTLRQALATVPGATLAGLPAVSVELEDSTKEGLPQSIAISVCLGAVLADNRFPACDGRGAGARAAGVRGGVHGSVHGRDRREVQSDQQHRDSASGRHRGGCWRVPGFCRTRREDAWRRQKLPPGGTSPHDAGRAARGGDDGHGLPEPDGDAHTRDSIAGMVAAVGIFASLIGSMCVLVPWLLRRADAR